MTHLRRGSLKLYSEALHRLHQSASYESFPTVLFETIHTFLPETFISLDEFNLKTHASRTAISREVANLESWTDRLRELVPVEHPAFAAVVSGVRAPLQISDFVTERQFRQTALYHDVLRPLGTLHQVVLPLSIPGHAAGLAVNRDRRFTADEIGIVSLLAPHIVTAHFHAQTYAFLRALQDESALATEVWGGLGLTPRETEVLHWVVLGKRDSEISIILEVSIRTVEKHMQNILAKLAVETRTAAAMRAMEIALHRPAPAG